MSRIEEALRRARLAESGEMAPVETADPVPPAVIAARPYLVKDTAAEVTVKTEPLPAPPPVAAAAQPVPRPLRVADPPEMKVAEPTEALADARADQMRPGHSR